MGMYQPLLRIEVITPEHEDYVEFGHEDFAKNECQVCRSKGHQKLFLIWWDLYGADIVHCKDCLRELRRQIDALRILTEFGIDTK